ncbi:MAG: tetratricopeptide repeat protein, partial [Thermoguttaceae bacterium]|nr:tetratricopeptide repeat protein [Thermoguttaceae bacterium]
VDAGKSEAAKADESFQKAIEDCDKAISLDSKFADAYYLKGVVAQYQGSWEQGIDAFSECVKIDPDRAEAYHRRGEIYDHIGDYMNSSVDFKKASELGYSDGTEQVAADVDLNDFSDLNYEPEEGADAQDPADSESSDVKE